nr:hypothetical protein [Yersinia enterocolitica]
WFGRNRAHKETGYMAAIPERYFQEKTLGLLEASIYGGTSHQGRFYGVFTIYLFSPLRFLTKCQPISGLVIFSPHFVFLPH